MSRVPAGAVAVIGGASRSGGRAAAALGPGASVFADGPIELAWLPSSDLAVTETPDRVCLIAGAVFAPGQAALADRAAALAAAPDAAAVERLLPGLRGDFWMLWWDRRDRRGVVVCDQMGAGAPYWSASGGEIVIASEIVELLAALRSAPGADPVALAHWVVCTIAPEGRMLFDRVRRLEAGHLLPVAEGEAAQPRRWWLPVYVEPDRAPRDEFVERIRHTLTAAVNRRVGDPERLAVLLSGGLDSSAVAACAVDGGRRPRAYSAVFPDHPAVDEATLIAATRARLGIRGGARIAVRSGSVVAGAIDFIETWGVPPTTPNMFFWRPLLERAGDDGIDVLLDGEGGDELFGLSPYLLADMLLRGRFRRARRLADGWPPPYHETDAARIRLRLRRFGVMGAMPAAAHSLSRRLRGTQTYMPPWLPPSLGAAWLDSEDSTFAWKRLEGPRWWASLVHGVTRGPGPALVYETGRRRAALAGISARHPLVDVDVIELVLRIPPELAFDGRYSRPLLREALAGRLPDEVRLRQEKSRFDTLFHDLLAGRDLPFVAELLADPAAELRAYIDLDSLRAELVDRSPPTDGQARRAWALRLWRLLTGECWLRHASDPESLRELRRRLPTEPDDQQILGAFD